MPLRANGDCDFTESYFEYRFVLIKHFKESGLAPETKLRTQRSRPFPKLKGWLIFGVLEKRESLEKFLENCIF